MKNEMWKVRNLLLCNPKIVEDYTEGVDNVSVLYNSGTNITITWVFETNEEGMYLIEVNEQFTFGRYKNVYKGYHELNDTLYKIQRYKNRTADERWFDTLRKEGYINV